MAEEIPISVLFIVQKDKERFDPLMKYLSRTKHLQLDVKSKLPEKLSQWDVVVTSDSTRTEEASVGLTDFVMAGGGAFHFIHPDTREMPSMFGVQPDAAGPPCELRVLFDQRDHPLSVRLADAIYVKTIYRPLFLEADDVEVLMYTDWHFQHKSVLTQRSYGQGIAACTSLWDFDHPVFNQIIHRVIRSLGGQPMTHERLGVGILGYAPSVGQYHGQGIVQTPGLKLCAACDLSPERLEQAREDFPEIKTLPTAKDLIHDPHVDLAIIATPPNTHAELANQLMAAGKHVVCEKPLALSNAETAAMLETARQHGVHLSCHQNRRWDVDYLAIKQAVDDDLIGDLFYMEAFVGGFSHPCGYWHSDAAISGGTSFDWGGHYIDWIISLFGRQIESVSGSRHKRVWHDVTNADQESIQIQFKGGGEAQFIHSDIAAARKPKWYLLGTRGAIVGQWQDVTEYTIDPVHYFRRYDIPSTEMPPDLTIYQRHSNGNITELKPAIPERSIFGFHRNIADHVLLGEPLSAPLEDSVMVVAVLEAAARSMENGGRLEHLHV